MIQIYCDSLNAGFYLAQIEDNIGTSVLEGGSIGFLILKYTNHWYPIIGFKYKSDSSVAMFGGSFWNGEFKGLRLLI